MKIISFILFFILIQNLSFGQNIDVNNYTIEDGLSQSNVTCIYQAKNRIIWIGTHDGLNAFDGYKFYIFRHAPSDTNTISDNYINDITEDKQGNLLIATRNGLNKWNKKTGKFTQLISNKLKDTEILQIISKDNYLWAVSSKNLYKIINSKIKLYKIPLDTNLIQHKAVTIKDKYSIIFDDDGNLWIGTHQGIFIFYPKSEQFYHLKTNAGNKLSSNYITYLTNFKDNILIGTAKGINLFEKQTNSIKNIFYLGKNNFNENNFIKYLYIDKNNKLIATLNGLKTLKNDTIIDFDNPVLKFENQNINSIIRDCTGNFWIGTSYNGLYKITEKEKTFNIRHYINDQINSPVFAINKDKNNNLWIGGEKLLIVSENFDIKNYKINNNNINNHFIIRSFFNDNNIMWIGTDKGIFISNINKFDPIPFSEYFKIKNKNSDELSNNTILNIFKDIDFSYWIGTTNGLYHFKNKTLKYYPNSDYNKKSITLNSVIKIKPFNDSLLILSTNNGIIFFNKKNASISKYYNSSNGLPTNFISDVYIDSDTIIWATSSTGLIKLNIETNKITTFTSQNTGFINDFFYNIEYLDNENFLLSSNYGIVKFNKKSHLYYTYEKKDGLPFYEFNLGAVYTDKQYIYFGGIKGITSIKKSQQTTNNHPINILITKIEILSSNHQKQTIYFPSTDSIYKFHYSDIIQVFYTIPEYTCTYNKFQFKIDNINNVYSKATTNNSIYLTGLTAGKHKLLIKGQNYLRQDTQNPATLNFTIIPAFWQSQIIKFLIIFLITGLISAIFLIFYLKVKKHNKALIEQNKSYQQLNIQNIILEERAHNLTDSLNYASKIIDAMLPSINKLKEIDTQSFIFYKPKDIVSGDFYWFVERNNHYYIAAVDCTGHGIPGAFMSIIGMNLLERFVNDGVTDPSVILNLMNKQVILTLKKNLDSKHLKDGMDMSLCIIDKQHKILKFSGAYNPAYIIRNKNIIQLKGDRKSVGTVFDFISFSSLNLKIQKNDYIYLFTDGYTDQFGGREHKKFKFRRFRELLLAISNIQADKKSEKLQETLDNWTNGSEQVDDILIIGFKPYSIVEPF